MHSPSDADRLLDECFRHFEDIRRLGQAEDQIAEPNPDEMSMSVMAVSIPWSVASASSYPSSYPSNTPYHSTISSGLNIGGNANIGILSSSGYIVGGGITYALSIQPEEEEDPLEETLSASDGFDVIDEESPDDEPVTDSILKEALDRLLGRKKKK